MQVVLQTSLEGIPLGAKVTLKDRHCDITVNFLKRQVFFSAKIKYPFPDTCLAEKYQVYTEDNTLIEDGDKLSKYEISEKDTLYLREEGVRHIVVHCKEQCADIWVKSNVTVEAIIRYVCTKGGSELGLDAGSLDMYDLFDAASSSGREDSSTSLSTMKSSEQGKALARNKTLEQLGFTESPELELREKSDSTSLPDIIRVTTEVVTPTSFHIIWSKPASELADEFNQPPVKTPNGTITAYILEYSESSGDAPPCSISLSGVVEEHTVTGLKPHTEYYVKVAAVNAAGRGPFCEPVLVQTAPDNSSLPDIIGVTTEAVTCTGFHVVWKKPEAELNIELSWYKPPAVEASSGPITAYILEYGERRSSAPPCSISLSGVVEEHTVTGLKPHTEYFVKVAAVNAAGRGPFCEPVLVRTAPDKPVAAPENVQVEASEDKPSIFVTWSPIQKQYYNSDSLTGYHVRYTTSSKDCKGGEIEVQPDETSRSLDFLDRGVAYAVSVAAANDVGMGPYSIPLVAMVLGVPPDAPAHQVKVVPDNVMSTSFHLTWCPPPVETANGPITAYILEYSESSGETPPRTISLSGVDEEHTVTGLKPHTEYYVKVAAVNAAGRGPFCEPVLVQTAPDKPVAAPENVQVEASEDKPSIFVTWSPIQKQYYNSDSLTGYHVRYTTSSKDCRGGEIEVQPDETSRSLDFLDRGVAYAVSVAAANDVGMGPYSSPSVAIVGAPESEEADDLNIDLILRRATKVLENLIVVSPSGRGLSSNYHLIYIAIMDITVLPYLVDFEHCVEYTISELCSLLRLQNPSEWYLTKSHGLQVLMSGKSKFQPAVGLSRRNSKKGKKPCFTVGSALSTALDVDHLLDVTKTWAEADLQSEPCIVHMRPWDSKKVKIREEIDFGVVEDAELGQQMYQPWYRITQGHHPVDKATAAEVAALMCMCQPEQVDGSPRPKTSVDDYLPKKLQRKSSMRKAAVKKYNTEKSTTKDVLTAQLQRCLADLPACNGIFFHIKIPGSGPFGPKMKKGVFGVGPKEIAYGCYDGDTVEVMIRRAYTEIKCFHAYENSFTVDFGAHDADEFQASTPRAFDIMHLLKIYIQQLPFLDEPPAVVSHEDHTGSLAIYDTYPTLIEADVLNPYWRH